MGQFEKEIKKSFCWRPNPSNNGELKLRAYGKRQIKVDSFSKGRK